MANTQYDPTNDDGEMIFGSEEEILDSLKAPVIPAGDYTFQFVKWEFKKSRAKQLPGVNFQFKCLDCAEFPNATIFRWDGWKTKFLTETLAALAGPGGLAGARITLPELEDGSCEFLNGLVGTEFSARIKVETYKDEEAGDETKSNKIARYL